MQTASWFPRDAAGLAPCTIVAVQVAGQSMGQIPRVLCMSYEPSMGQLCIKSSSKCAKSDIAMIEGGYMLDLHNILIKTDCCFCFN